MKISIISIVEPQTTEEFEAYFLVRYNVLRKPLGKPKGSERDEMEMDCAHAMAIDSNGKIIGVCRLQFNSPTQAQIRYMAVIEKEQGRGIGKRLIQYMEDKAKQRNVENVILHARSSALNFYLNCGYTNNGKSYLMWDSIQHYLMYKFFKV